MSKFLHFKGIRTQATTPFRGSLCMFQRVAVLGAGDPTSLVVQLTIECIDAMIWHKVAAYCMEVGLKQEQWLKWNDSASD